MNGTFSDERCCAADEWIFLSVTPAFRGAFSRRFG
jgi:hypothetical protein